jgi:RNA-directed DNA polymerase
VDETVARLNRLLGGWANYFCLETVTKAYRQVTAHACDRLRRWLTQKLDLRGPQKARFSDRYLHETLGLLRLQRPSAQLS